MFFKGLGHTPKAYVFAEGTIVDDITGEEKDVLCFCDGNGLIMPKKEALEKLEKVKVFYESNKVDDFISKRNADIYRKNGFEK